MLGWRTFIAVAVTLCWVVGGCQRVGPIAIDQGRDRYNDVIQATSKEQVLSNLVRVYNHEPTSFMDVSEVDATTTLSGNVSGAISGIGAQATHSTTAGTLAGQVGNVGGGVVYTEQPLIRYTPLLGQALVAQLVTPVSVDVLEDLFDSGWAITPLLDLATSYLTPDLWQFHPVLNIITELDSHRALTLAATKSELTKQQAPAATSKVATLEVTTKPSGGGGNDALTIYLNTQLLRALGSDPKRSRPILHLWARLLWLYAGTQQPFKQSNTAQCEKIGLSSRNGLSNWEGYLRLERRGLSVSEALQCLPNSIELRAMPVPSAKARAIGLVTGAPVMKTSSALGILKSATEKPGPKVAFVSPERQREITGYKWNKDANGTTHDFSFYLLLPKSEDPNDNPTPKAEAKTDQDITKWIEEGGNSSVYEPRAANLSVAGYLNVNRRLGSLRRYILVIMDDHLPANPVYVSHYDRGVWYYIAADDEISQKNFNLISLFLTMMAVPSALPPISPTISVGGGG